MGANYGVSAGRGDRRAVQYRSSIAEMRAGWSRPTAAASGRWASAARASAARPGRTIRPRTRTTWYSGPPNCDDGGDETQTCFTFAAQYPNRGLLGMPCNCRPAQVATAARTTSAARRAACTRAGSISAWATGASASSRTPSPSSTWYQLLVQHRRRDHQLGSVLTRRLDEKTPERGIPTRANAPLGTTIASPFLFPFHGTLRMRRSHFLLAFLIAPLAASPGCGGDNTVWITGKLLKGGTRYEVPKDQLVTVTFIALEVQDSSGKTVKSGEPYLAELDPDSGTFAVPGPERRGIPPGKYRVAITQRLTREAFDAAKPKSTKKRRTRETDTLGDQYSLENSPITIEVTRSDDVTIDMDSPKGSPKP